MAVSSVASSPLAQAAATKLSTKNAGALAQLGKDVANAPGPNGKVGTVVPVPTGGVSRTVGKSKSSDGSTSMPLDTDAQIALEQALQGKQTYLQNLALQRQSELQNYTNESHDLTVQHPLDQASLNSNYGSRGLGFSSGYGNAATQLETAYDTNTSRLVQAHQDAINQLNADQTNYLNAYKLNKSALRQAAADRLSAVAGTLGLGTPTTNASTLSSILQGN